MLILKIFHKKYLIQQWFSYPHFGAEYGPHSQWKMSSNFPKFREKIPNFTENKITSIFQLWNRDNLISKLLEIASEVPLITFNLCTETKWCLFICCLNKYINVSFPKNLAYSDDFPNYIGPGALPQQGWKITECMLL